MKTETQQKKNLPVTRKLVLDGSFSEDDAEANRTNVNPDF